MHGEWNSSAIPIVFKTVKTKALFVPRFLPNEVCARNAEYSKMSFRRLFVQTWKSNLIHFPPFKFLLREMALLSSTTQACGLTGVQSHHFVDGSNLIKFLIQVHTLHLPLSPGKTSSIAAPVWPCCIDRQGPRKAATPHTWWLTVMTKTCLIFPYLIFKLKLF